MTICKIEITDPMGLHLRPAMVLCAEAQKYKACVFIKVRNVEANLKSVLNILAAGVRMHDEIVLMCEGEDEEEALEALRSMICPKLGREVASDN